MQDSTAETIVFGSFAEAIEREIVVMPFHEVCEAINAFIRGFEHGEAAEWAQIIIDGGHIACHARSLYAGGYSIEEVRIWEG